MTKVNEARDEYNRKMKRIINTALQITHGNISATCRMLDITYPTVKKYGDPGLMNTNSKLNIVDLEAKLLLAQTDISDDK